MLRTPAMVGAACSSRSCAVSTSRPYASYSFMLFLHQPSRAAPRSRLITLNAAICGGLSYPFFPIYIHAQARDAAAAHGQRRRLASSSGGPNGSRSPLTDFIAAARRGAGVYEISCARILLA